MDNWISVKDALPKLQIFFEEKTLKMNNSIECIVTDGETSWGDFFTADEGFHQSITHWMLLPSPPINEK